MRKAECAWEPLRRFLDDPDCDEMIRSYYDEMGSLAEAAPLDPDWPTMMRMEAEDRYKLCVCRVGGVMAGFLGFYVLPHMLHRTTLFATDNVFFVDHAMRGRAMLGLKMWRWAIDKLQAEGVGVIVGQDNARRPLNKLFERLGFNKIGSEYARAL